MSIFNKSLSENKISREEIKKRIMNFLISDTTIVSIYAINGLNNMGISMKNFPISDFLIFFLNENGLWYKKEDFSTFSLYELIEIYLNLFNQREEILTKYIDHQNEKDDCNYEGYKLKNIFREMSCLIKKFLNENNIKVVINDKLYELWFSHQTIFEKNESDINTVISKYIIIREKYNEESLTEKEKTICFLKNKLDFYFKNPIENTKFVSFNNKELMIWWQAKFSHEGSENLKNPEFEKRKNEYKKFTLHEKHKICDEIFDAIIYILYKKAYNNNF